jgi:hypothetical protein
MNNQCRQLFDALKLEVTDLHLRWVIYRQLYASSEAAIDLLNRSGSNVFYLLQFLLLDDCSLRLSKLTDPPSQGKFKNLSIKKLVDTLIKSDSAFPRGEVLKLFERLKERCDKFRQLRNKRIAHSDLDHTLMIATTPLPGISREDIEKALESLSDILNAIEYHYFNSQTLYAEVIVPHHADGNKLLRLLAVAHGERMVI